MPEDTAAMTTGVRGSTMIRLDQLEKRYPGQDRFAVAELDMEVPEGEIVVLVGPSGCGKTTTLKMINRIIEPSGGRIFLEGEDVTAANPDRLRRRIGYVIQQVGLFPHMTIAANIATVPKMLGWDRARITSRVEELLELVGLEPARYRNRYPKELSGGQQQSAGVARALGADPPVMLMDEPFGAVDPIQRQRLQDEFLRLQREIKKTIVLVTHDIDEAIKMGDRIAILRDESRIAQYATPTEILANPANEFVEEFIGAGSAVKRLTLTRVADVPIGSWPTIEATADDRQLLELFRRTEKDFVLQLDEQHRPTGWLTRQTAYHRSLPRQALPIVSTVKPQATLLDALNAMLRTNSTCAVVVDQSNTYRGTLDFDSIHLLVQSDVGQEVSPKEGIAPAVEPKDGA